MTAVERDPAFEALLEFLKRSRGFDFTGYKRTSLVRRFRRRMDALECESFGDYLDYLEVHPEEYENLFDALLINVTEFFRDPPSWVHLRDQILPQLLAAKEPDDPIRVWSAGCASGQEAYTAAIVLAEALDEDGLPRAGEDLRHGHRRGGARDRAAGRLLRRRTSSRSPTTCARSTSSPPTSDSPFARTCAGR